MNFFKLSKFFLYLAPFSVVLVVPSTIFPYIVGKYVFFRTTVSLALIFFSLGLLFGGKHRSSPENIPDFKAHFKNPLVVAVSFFVLVFVLAGFFGVDPAYSFWSNFERGEGGLQLLYFWIFFALMVLLFKRENDWQKIFWLSVCAAVLMILYGVGSGLKYVDAEKITVTENGVPKEVMSGNGGPFFLIFKNFIGPALVGPESSRFQGSIGNAAYVAVYLVFAVFYALYLLFDKYRYRLKSFAAVGLAAIILVFLVFFFLAATRGAFVGLIAAILAGFVYVGISIKNWRKWVVSAGIVLLLLVGFLVYYRDSSLVKSIPGSRIFDISFFTENIQERMIVWKMAFDGVKERPIFGWGTENFPVVFDKYYNPEHYSAESGFGAWYDRAHNIFLDYLIAAGFLGLFGFLAVFAVFYWQFFRARNKSELSESKRQSAGGRRFDVLQKALIFAVPVAYLVQGLVLFDILPTYINLFLFLAFAAYKFSILNEFSTNKLNN